MANETVQQAYDLWSDQPRQRPEVEREMSTRATIAFREDFPEYRPTPQNWERISQYLQQQNVPVTRRNLAIVYRLLLEEGFLETVVTTEVTYSQGKPERGIQRMVAEPVKRYDTEAVNETSLLREDHKRLGKDLAIGVVEKRLAENAENYSLSEIGKPVSKELKTKFYQSLGTNQRSASTGMTQGEARSIVLLHIEDNNLPIRPNTAEFNSMVAKVLRDNQ